MKTFAVLLSVLLVLPALPAIAAPDAEAAPTTTITGGHWQAGAASGTYRVIAERVGFEHVSCRVWIEWLTAAGRGQPARVTARVPFAEASTGFWSCEPDTKATTIVDNTLTLRMTHAYSLEARTFVAILGAPGEYRIAQE